MIENPDDYIPAFVDAGANWISVHQEACVHLDRVVEHIRSRGCWPEWSSIRQRRWQP